MKIGEDFTQIGNIPKGEIIVKFPGTDFKMLFESGNAFLSNSGIGYVALAIRDAVCEQNGEAEGLTGALGLQISQQVNDPSIRGVLKGCLSKRDHSLFYSRGQDGTEILTIPGMSGEWTIDGENIPGSVVAIYSSEDGQIPTPEKIYAHHVEALGGRSLVTDRGELEREVLDIVSKTNAVYKRGLELQRELGF